MAEMDGKELESLMSKTNLEKQEIIDMFKGFMNENPTGEMSKEQFIETCDEDTKDIAESLFNVFDKDGSGTMDFWEYMLASNATCLTSPEEKLNWIFDVFDKDCGGTIDPEEGRDVVKSLFNMAGIELEEEILADRIEEMLKAIDADGDGEITKDEFIKNALSCEFIHDMLTVGMDPGFGSIELENRE
jgi:Ca2+-binding EF-hand superfamily protein